MPEPVRSGQRYMPGLDGLRALAVLAVIAYHEQFGWAPGPAARSANPQHKPARGPVQLTAPSRGRFHIGGVGPHTRAVSLRNRQIAPPAKMASQTMALTAQVHCTPSPSSGACTSSFSP